MLRTEIKTRHFAALTTVLIATAEALAQENPAARQARRILVSVPDRKLAVIEEGRVVKIYRTAVGKPSTPSPEGSFTIVQRLIDPTWYYRGKIVAPGKANPLGTRWLGLSAKGYGIHGTNVPSSIGRNASHGCIRMRNSDVEQLFELVAVGDVVELRHERDEEIERIFGVSDAAPVVAANAGAAVAGGGQ